MNGSDYEEFVNSLNRSGKSDEYNSSIENETVTANNHHFLSSKKRKIEELDEGKSSNDIFGYVEIKKLEHCTRTLQKNIKLIINEAPDLAEVKRLLTSEKLDQNTIFDLENNELIQLAAQLKTKYKSGSLKVFDSIINNNANTIKEDEYSEVDEESSWTKKSKSAESIERKPSKVPKAKESDVPELPVINDVKLYNRVFIHKSIINNKSYLHKSELMASHNERLEFLGDSVLNNLVTVIIFNKFPEATEGELSKIRSLLVNNVTLAEFSIIYGFDKKLRSNINEQILKDSTQKIYADIFEAYIGALAIERKFDYTEIQQWLTALMENKLSKHARQISSTEEINKDAKSELYSLIGTAAFHPQYEVIKTGDGSSNPFVIKCTMGNDVLGIGTAPSNKDAGLRAAMEALKNKRLLEKYSQIRFNMDRNQSVISNKGTKNAPLLALRSQSNEIHKYDTNIFPLIADAATDVDSKAKNELYSILGKNMGVTPIYETHEMASKQFRAELKVKGVHIATAVDATKKKACSKAAMAIINNKEALDALSSL